MKTRPSKTKIFIWNFIPITLSFIYHPQKAKKSLFATQKSLRVLNLLRFFIDRAVFRIHSDKVLFMFFIEKDSLQRPQW